MSYSYSKKYVPDTLTKKDKRKQMSMLKNSRNLYKEKRFYTRKKVASFVSKPSGHVKRATASGCPLSVLQGIVRKGEGAYYSSGSRPNQTAQSWAYARLASALTGGNASKVDFHLIQKCNPRKKAYLLAKKRLAKK